MDLKALLSELTLAEKAALLSGTRFTETNPVPRLKLPGLKMADGPHGLRKQIGTADNGVGQSVPATCFPTSAAMASSWNPENARRAGEAIAAECRAHDVNVLLGPGVNIKRNPRCGRNFEYYSEDPLVSGVFGAAFVQGVQSRGVGVSLKHFAANNTENYRFMGESVVDERALREIYLRAFEQVVKAAQPATVMSAYNQIWGEFCSENKRLLTDILRTEWGFDGVVMTDWGGANDRVQGLIAGLDLEMPGDTDLCRSAIIDGVQSGRLPGAVLDRAVMNLLRLIDRNAGLSSVQANSAAHHELAGEIARDSAVLLHNDGILPLSRSAHLTVAGTMFEHMRYQGAGSSMIAPLQLTSPREAFDSRGINYTHEHDGDVIIYFGGLTDDCESEGGDRTDLRLPQDQLTAIDSLIATGKPVVVVLFGGAPMELPFAEQVAAILYMVLPGQNGGSAVADLLFGVVSPSGKLAETWPLKGADVPYDREFATSEIELYKESIFVGYRYFATALKPVHYPFGFGLSYTQFAYSNLSVQAVDDKVLVTFDIENTGNYAGAEVIQVYSGLRSDVVFRPRRELRGFAKVYLASGEKQTVSIQFDRRDLAFYHSGEKNWVLENGCYTLEVGASSMDIRLQTELIIDDQPSIAPPYSQALLRIYPAAVERVSDASFAELLGAPIPARMPRLPLRWDSIFTDWQQTWMGKVFYNAILSVARKQEHAARRLPPGIERDNKQKGALFLRRILSSNSLRTLYMCGSERLPYHVAQAMLLIANGSWIKGFRALLGKLAVPPLPRDQKTQMDEKVR